MSRKRTAGRVQLLPEVQNSWVVFPTKEYTGQPAIRGGVTVGTFLPPVGCYSWSMDSLDSKQQKPRFWDEWNTVAMSFFLATEHYAATFHSFQHGDFLLLAVHIVRRPTKTSNGNKPSVTPP